MFVHDRQTGQTTRVSVTSDGSQANNSSVDPRMSADGRFVAFQSGATNLVAGDTNGNGDIFVHDRQTGQTTRVSVTSSGAQAGGNSIGPEISADGRFVAFASGSFLVAGDTTSNYDMLVHDRQTGQTTRVSVASDGTQADRDSVGPSLSADGRFVAFLSPATNLVAGDTNAVSDVFVHDRHTGQTTRVSVAGDGAQANGENNPPALSADGRFVSFTSAASNLVGDDTNGTFDVFVAISAPADATAPVLDVPGDLTVSPVDASGAPVTFAVSATDETDPAPQVVCDPMSGSTFPLGSTTVSCTATDAAGNAGTASFLVRVVDTTPPVAAIQGSTDLLVVTSPAPILVSASDVVGVASVLVNNVPATLVSGTSQSGTWRADVPVQVPGMALVFAATVSDGAGNAATTPMLVADNDGILSAIDKNRTTLSDETDVFSSTFVQGDTVGTIRRTTVSLQASPSGSEVLVSSFGSAAPSERATAHTLCTGSSKWVDFNTNEAARLRCVANTLYVTGVSGTVDVARYDGRSCHVFFGCTYYYTRFSLAPGSSAWLGSPVTTDPGNPGPLHVDLVRVNGGETEPRPRQAQSIWPAPRSLDRLISTPPNRSMWHSSLVSTERRRS